jgi:glycolate oxidase iron-sulfur subunit
MRDTHRSAAALISAVGATYAVSPSGCCGALHEHAGLLPATRELAERVGDLPRPAVRSTVIVQDPCHLRHVQRVHGAVRSVLGRVADVVELDDDGLCCGAGGAYSALQPALASEIRERKLAAIARATERSGTRLVASANPGCAMHLAAAGVEVRHPVDIVADAIHP